jgi:hypothetical protein
MVELEDAAGEVSARADKQAIKLVLGGDGAYGWD